MKLLLDGDILCYRVSYSTKEEVKEDGTIVKYPLTPQEAVARLDELIQYIRSETTEYADYQVYLTGQGNFRNEIAKTAVYKGNRKDTEKPQNLDYLRAHLQLNYKTDVSVNEEADDLIAIEATKLGPDRSIIVSTDKDFKQVPSTIFNPSTGQFTRVDAWSGLKAFYTQILTGDTVDNILGIYGIGPKKAEAILSTCDSEKALYNACVEAYKGDADRVVENGRLLWLRRYPGQIWSPPDASTIS
jgi:5'-3' exonuclease